MAVVDSLGIDVERERIGIMPCCILAMQEQEVRTQGLRTSRLKGVNVDST